MQNVHLKHLSPLCGNKWFNKMLRFTLNTPEGQLREDSCEEGHTGETKKEARHEVMGADNPLWRPLKGAVKEEERKIS